jgi:hypothetical protein
MKTYSTPAAFKVAPEARIRSAAGQEKLPIDRIRQCIVFERFAAGLLFQFPNRITITGGIALELRLATACATKDFDVRLTGSSAEILTEL